MNPRMNTYKTAEIAAVIGIHPRKCFVFSYAPVFRRHVAYEVMLTALQKIADILPLTQGIKLLKAASLGWPVANMPVPLMVMSVIAIICIAVSLKCFKWE